MSNFFKKTFPLFLFIVFTAIAVGTFYILLNQQNYFSTENNLKNTQASAQEVVAGGPVYLIIPSLDINARVEHLGLDANGVLKTPVGPHTVAWYNQGPKPGQKGSAVISGHYGPWRSGEGSVFDELNTLTKGDKVQVRDDKGNTISFTVIDMRTYDADDHPAEVFNRNDGAYLNLITCSGTWLQTQETYTQRLVVFTKAD